MDWLSLSTEVGFILYIKKEIDEGFFRSEEVTVFAMMRLPKKDKNPDCIRDGAITLWVRVQVWSIARMLFYFSPS